jgi:hypothetical protein
LKTFTVIASGEYNNLLIWQGGLVPNGTCNIVVNSPFTLNISAGRVDADIRSMFVYGNLKLTTRDPSGFALYSSATLFFGPNSTFEKVSTDPISDINLYPGSFLIFASGARVVGNQTGIHMFRDNLTTAVRVSFSLTASNFSGMTFYFPSLADVVRNFTGITFIIGQTGSILSRSTWSNLNAPSADFCQGDQKCTMYIPPNITVSMDALNNQFSLPISRIQIDTDATLEMGIYRSPAAFVFPSTIRIDVRGTLKDDSASTGGIYAAAGSVFNFLTGAEFIGRALNSLRLFNTTADLSANASVVNITFPFVTFTGPQLFTVNTTEITSSTTGEFYERDIVLVD